MKIKLTSVFVDDQGKALKFYTEVLGFIKKSDITAGKFRWLTVVSPEEQDGTQLLLEPNDNPAAKSSRNLSSSKVFPQLCSSLMIFRESIRN
jgi:catechol 2,3-dioxygenase-like lactoylglutathione lyase family enzyme